MTNKFAAALLAALTFAGVLAVVPLATAEPADAHPRTKTVQRCSYDPFAGQQCWNETVNVSHVHRCGAGMTGTYPNCYPIPPVIQPVCPAGMTGTPPNCYPPPPATTQPPPPTTTQPPPQCPAGQVGTPPNCQTPQCPAGQTGTPPNCKTPPPPKCPAGQVGTPPNCQTPKCPAGQTGTPPNCQTPPTTTTTKDPCGDYAQDLLDALNKVNDGTNRPPTLPATPTQCIGSSTSKLLTAIGNALAALGKGHPNNSEEIRKSQRKAYESHRDVPIDVECGFGASLGISAFTREHWATGSAPSGGAGEGALDIDERADDDSSGHDRTEGQDL